MENRFGWVALVVLIGTALLAKGEPMPSPDELLARMEKAYAEIRSYEAVGDFTFEYFGWYTTRIPFRIWASYPCLRIEYEPVVPTSAYGASLRMPTVIADVAAGRQFVQTLAGSWVEEEIAFNWTELGILQPYVSGETAFTSLVGEEDLDGRPAWVLEGHTETGGWKVSVRVWVDQESLWVRKTRTESPGVLAIQTVHDLRLDVEIPDEAFLLPSGANVIVRPPRSPEAEAIMDQVWERYVDLTSFYLRTTEHARETVGEAWYRDPVLRVESTSLFHIPAQTVMVWDLDRGAMYHFAHGEWRGTEFFPVSPEFRSSLALAVAVRLVSGYRYTSVEEDTVGDRPTWRITGEPQTVLDEPSVARWWVDRETYAVLQYEEPTTAVVAGVIGKGVRTVRVERFEPDAEVPPEKLVVPEGVPIRWFGAPGPLATDEPGERAEQGVRWDPFSEEHLAEARAEGRPVLLYFTADWCRPCREFEDGALHDARVVAAAEGLVRIVVDLTDWGSPEAAQMRSAHRVGAVPLVVALRPDGLEAGRAMGNVVASVLLDALRFVAPMR